MAIEGGLEARRGVARRRYTATARPMLGRGAARRCSPPPRPKAAPAGGGGGGVHLGCLGLYDRDALRLYHVRCTRVQPYMYE
jgi:hypothetical protein